MPWNCLCSSKSKNRRPQISAPILNVSVSSFYLSISLYTTEKKTCRVTHCKRYRWICTIVLHSAIKQPNGK